eukprot:TRINITY_DN62171_c0_g1_i1.p1 TRINITY_DN62171_c0_g1~~TRINITY_DN62171_c0_g1_i1.p1  ORF type:complete len:426 (-),score=60.72 TRINITY_DN62171_c0_g1_i1:220-1497(-)
MSQHSHITNLQSKATKVEDLLNMVPDVIPQQENEEPQTDQFQPTADEEEPTGTEPEQDEVASVAVEECPEEGDEQVQYEQEGEEEEFEDRAEIHLPPDHPAPEELHLGDPSQQPTEADVAQQPQKERQRKTVSTSPLGGPPPGVLTWMVAPQVPIKTRPTERMKPFMVSKSQGIPPPPPCGKQQRTKIADSELVNLVNRLTAQPKQRFKSSHLYMETAPDQPVLSVEQQLEMNERLSQHPANWSDEYMKEDDWQRRQETLILDDDEVYDLMDRLYTAGVAKWKSRGETPPTLQELIPPQIKLSKDQLRVISERLYHNHYPINRHSDGTHTLKHLEDTESDTIGHSQSNTLSQSQPRALSTTQGGDDKLTTAPEKDQPPLPPPSWETERPTSTGQRELSIQILSQSEAVFQSPTNAETQMMMPCPL